MFEPLLVLDAEAVAARLDYPGCMAAVREAMIALSRGHALQLLRTIIPMGDRGVFAQMPGALGEDDMFGAKLISVFSDHANPSRKRHRGVVVLFEPTFGSPVCVADAEEVTFIRTAAMTALATDALARRDAKVLTLYGHGGQASRHLKAISLVRSLSEVRVWGRSSERAQLAAQALAHESGLPVTAFSDGQAAAEGADILCTITNANDPVLFGKWLSPGAHVNLVGSSVPGPVEVDQALVVNSRFISDSRASTIVHGAEFRQAKEAGAITDDHLVAEIGAVFDGSTVGRQSDKQITVFKSIGHAIQDLASAAYLYRKRGAIGPC